MKLHIGCGKRYLAVYVHIDPADYPHIDYRVRADKLEMIEDGSAEIIYASHILEYYDRTEVPAVLKEWNRVLKKEGIIRLAVPDYEKLWLVYQKTGDISKILGPLFGRWEVPGTDEIIYHKTVYDYNSLKTILEENGFEKIKRWDWKEVFTGENEGFDDYSQAYFPHMQ